jgi:hypothetical protein
METPMTSDILYEVQFLRIGLAGLYRIIATLSQPISTTGSQFSLRSLFFVVMSTAIGLATARLAFYADDWGRIAITTGICSLVPASILSMCVAAHRRARPDKTPTVQC